MLAREQHRQQDPGNLVVAQGAPLLVAGVHERLHEVVGPGPGTAARGHDLAEELGHPSPGPIAASMRRGRKPGEEEPQRVDALLQVVIGLREALVQLFPDFLADEATAGDLDGQLVHGDRQVDFSFLPEGVGELPGLLGHDAGEPLHRGPVEGREQELELLVHDLGSGVVSHPAAEDGHRELVDRLGVQLLLGRSEIAVVGFGSGEEHELAGTEPEPDELAPFPPAAAQHRDRIFLELQQMTEQRPSAGEFGNGFCRRRRELLRMQRRRPVGPVGHTCPQ